MKKFVLVVAVLLISTLAWAAGGRQQADGAWAPSRSVDFVVTASAGGGSDIFARQISDILAREGYVTQTIVVTNDSAAVGEPARARVSGARGAIADHTIMVFNAGDLMTMVTNTPRRVSDFTPLGILATDFQLLYVSRTGRFQSFQDIMDAVNRGERVVAGGGRGDDQLTFEMLLREMGWTEAQVPYIIYMSSTEAIVATLGDHLDVVISKPAASNPFVEAGDLIPVLALAPQRYTGNLAGAPTVSEIGPFNNVYFPVWRGVAGPAAMSAGAQAFWSEVLRRVAETRTWRYDYLERFQLIPGFIGYGEVVPFMTNFQREFMTMQGIR